MRAKEIKVPILWEKTYYQNEFIGGTKKENWSGILFLYRFLILKGSAYNRFMIEPIYEEFTAKSKKDVVGKIVKLTKGIKEWELAGKNWKVGVFPSEVNSNLIKYKLKKHVKKIS